MDGLVKFGRRGGKGILGSFCCVCVCTYRFGIGQMVILDMQVKNPNAI